MPMPNPTLSLRDRLLAELVSRFGWGVIHCVARTSRLRTYWSPGFKDRLDQGQPVIYAFWHRFQLLLLFDHRARGVHVLVSRSRDGEMVARALRHFGYRTVRGSSSRGGGTAFLELLDVVKRGESVAFTPDGPRGPARSVQPGVLALAARTGIPIVPVAWAGSRTKELRSWDKMLVPLPFARYAVVYADPLAIIDEGPEAQARLRDALDQAARDAESRLSEI